MTSQLYSLIEKLGDGKVVKLDSGEVIFIIDSFEENPVVKPQDLGLTCYENGKLMPGAVFNGGTEIFNDKIVLTPRCHQGYQKISFFDKKLGIHRYHMEDYVSEVWPLVSNDGIHFKRLQDMVICSNGKEHGDFRYGIEDIRIIKHKKRHLLIGCGKIEPPFSASNHGDRTAIYSTKDFVNIKYHCIVKSFDSRNAVPFPEPVDCKHYVLLRFYNDVHSKSRNGRTTINLVHLEAGIEQLLEPFKHMVLWQKIYEQRSQSVLFKSGQYNHENVKIAPGTQPIKTDRGWLLIYHGVGEIKKNLCKAYGLSKRIKKSYSICAALLDLYDPRKVICRTTNPIYIPSNPYELYGNDQYPVDEPAVVFPVGALVLKK